MTPSDLAADLRALWPMEPEELLYWLADHMSGVTDPRAFLIELAQAVEVLERVGR